MMETTTILVTKETRELMHKLKGNGRTYDRFILDVLSENKEYQEELYEFRKLLK